MIIFSSHQNSKFTGACTGSGPNLNFGSRQVRAPLLLAQFYVKTTWLSPIRNQCIGTLRTSKSWNISLLPNVEWNNELLPPKLDAVNRRLVVFSSGISSKPSCTARIRDPPLRRQYMTIDTSSSPPNAILIGLYEILLTFPAFQSRDTLHHVGWRKSTSTATLPYGSRSFHRFINANG